MPANELTRRFPAEYFERRTTVTAVRIYVLPGKTKAKIILRMARRIENKQNGK